MDKSNMENNDNLKNLNKEQLIELVSTLNKNCEHLQKEVEKYKFYAFCDVMTTNECNKDCKHNTHIFNRTYWDVIYRDEHAKDECDFYLIDLNNLKIINDTKGHHHGDKHICNCVNLLTTYGTVFRLGGDEFVLIVDKDKEQSFKQYLDLNGYNLDFAYGYKHKTSKDTFYDVLKYTDNEMYKFKNKQKLANKNN